MALTEVSAELVAQLSQLAGITIAPEHAPGVIANLSVLLRQGELLMEQKIDPAIEPASVFRP